MNRIEKVVYSITQLIPCFLSIVYHSFSLGSPHSADVQTVPTKMLHVTSWRIHWIANYYKEIKNVLDQIDDEPNEQDLGLQVNFLCKNLDPTDPGVRDLASFFSRFDYRKV